MTPAANPRFVLREIARRTRQPKQPIIPELKQETRIAAEGGRVLAHLFTAQLKFISDKSKAKVARCGRRAGKTMAVAAGLCRTALDRAGALCGYIALTRSHAKRLMWKELKRLDRHYELGVIFHETDLEARFPNGSVIMLAGADKTDSIEKFRGLAFDEVVLDESASFKAHIEQLVEEVLKPTLEDFDGQVTLIGTPGRALIGMFFEASTEAGDRARTWSRHHWTVLDNPMFPRWRGRADWRTVASAWLLELRTREEWTEEDPTYVREWLGCWVRDHATLVYCYDENKNRASELPAGHEWSKVLGIDLGHDDDCAFVIPAFAKHLPDLYFTYAEKKKGMDVDDVVDRVAELVRTQGPFRSIVCDTGGLGKMIAKTMQRKLKLAVKPAEKKDKLAFTAEMNGDLRKSRVKVLPAAMALVGEWEVLQKDENGEEDDRFPNHCADAGLYSYRECRHYLWRPKEVVPPPGSPEALEREAREMEEADERDLREPDEVESMFT